MSTHGQVFIEPEKVYLYKHWDADMLPNMVKKALSHNECWDDYEYLARIIFNEMIDGESKFSGYGISGHKNSDIEYLISISENEKIKIECGYGKDWKVLFDGTFEEFINNKIKDWR